MTLLGTDRSWLRRAFIVAGARTLVMSLWKVPDEETREKAHVYMEGLAEMQREWLKKETRRPEAEGPRPKREKKK